MIKDNIISILIEIKKNKLAFASLIFIIIAAIVSILGYWLTPDKTPYANSQYLEISNQYPGFRCSFLKIKKNEAIYNKNIFYTMLFGRVSEYKYIPIEDYFFSNDSLYYKEYGGDIKKINVVDVVYSLKNSTINKKGNRFIFYDVKGGLIEESLENIKQQIVRDNIVKKAFWLGTDKYGRDMLSQLIIGTRVSLSVGLISVLISLLIGVPLGAIAGYYRGKADSVIMWLVNVVWSIPTTLLVIAITFALGKGFWQVFVAVGITMWVDIARIVRGQVISLREKDFILACRALGFSDSRIIIRHIIPNVIGPVIVLSAANFASAILIETGLSFLGLGVQPPVPSWGTMIKEHYSYIILGKSYLSFIPGFAIMIMVFAFMLLGNWLRDYLDPKYEH